MLLDKSSVGNNKSVNVKDIIHLSHCYLMIFLLSVVKPSPTQLKKVCLRNFFQVIQMKQTRVKEILRIRFVKAAKYYLSVLFRIFIWGAPGPLLYVPLTRGAGGMYSLRGSK